MNQELQQFERELAAMQPSRVSARLLERIAAGVAALPDPASAKVVPFPGGARPIVRHTSGARWLAVAAAVALLGAVAAILTPGLRHPSPVAQNPRDNAAGMPAAGQGTTAAARRGFVPTGSHAGVREVRDEGLLWPNKGEQPLRRVRVVYFERITLVNEHGEKIEVERPRVEYILLPEKIH